jgi:predicted dehydrogenase
MWAHSAEEPFDRPDVAAVLIVTSSNTHVDLIIKSVQAGKPVMCEKPLAPNLSDAKRCIDVLGSQENGAFFAFNRRFDSGHAEPKKAIEQAEIGSLEQLTITSRDLAQVRSKTHGTFRHYHRTTPAMISSTCGQGDFPHLNAIFLVIVSFLVHDVWAIFIPKRVFVTRPNLRASRK